MGSSRLLVSKVCHTSSAPHDQTNFRDHRETFMYVLVRVYKCTCVSVCVLCVLVQTKKFVGDESDNQFSVGYI